MLVRSLSALMLLVVLSGCSMLPNSTQPTSEANPTSAPTSAAEPTTTSAESPTNLPETGATSAPVVTDPRVKYERADCKFKVAEGEEVACGFLTVPEKWEQDTGKTVRLHVGVFKSKSADPKPDPIVYLEGGPGGNALSNWGENVGTVFGDYLADRDIVIFDQRGTGFSEPSLACPEYTKEAFAQLDVQLSVADSGKRYTDAMIACSDRLHKEGIDLSAFNSVESAGDLAALRTALGYSEWNVYGISYGTRLALTTMREHPEGIRSVVIDSVVPLQSKESETPADIDRAFTTFFQGCAKNTECNTAYPNLEDTFYKLIDTLNSKPVTEKVVDSTDGKSYDVLVSGDAVFGGLIFALYQTTVIPLMPKAITAAAAGTDYSLLARLAYYSTKQTEDISIGMLYAVRCNEEFPFESEQAFKDADNAFPRQRDLVDMGSFIPICNAFNAGKAPAVEDQPVKSSLPTLVLAGEYDPATPPADSKAASETLADSFFYEFPGYGHGESTDGDCATAITQAFFTDPTTEPDSSCIANLNGPKWSVPEGPITLTQVEDSDANIKGVAPQSWEKAGPGAWSNPSGDALLQQIASPRSKSEMLSLIQTQFKLTEAPKQGDDHQSGSRTWSTYSFSLQGQPAELALAEENGTTLFVLLVVPAAESQKLHDTLFIPALDALQLLK